MASQAPLPLASYPPPPIPSFRTNESKTANKPLLRSPRLSNAVYQLLSQTYVCCRALELSTETRFLIMVLLHRFLLSNELLVRNDRAQLPYGYYHRDDDSSSANSSTVDAQGPETKELHQKMGTSNSSTKKLDNHNTTMPLSHLEKVALGCIFVGCKANEEMRRIRDVMNVVHMIRTSPSSIPDGNTQTTFELKESSKPPPLNAQYWSNKDVLVSIEQDVLRMVNFDVHVSPHSPHRAALVLLEDLVRHALNSFQEARKEQPLNQQQTSQPTRKRRRDEGDDDVEAVGKRKQEKKQSKNENTNYQLYRTVQALLVPPMWRRFNDASFSPSALRHPAVTLASAALWMSLEEVTMKLEVFYKLEQKGKEGQGEDCAGGDKNETASINATKPLSGFERNEPEMQQRQHQSQETQETRDTSPPSDHDEYNPSLDLSLLLQLFRCIHKNDWWQRHKDTNESNLNENESFSSWEQTKEDLQDAASLSQQMHFPQN